IELPEADERLRFIQSSAVSSLVDGKSVDTWSDFPAEELANQLLRCNLTRRQSLLAEAVRNAARVTPEHLARGKKQLIEEYCQGLVRFKSPRAGLNLDAVATHHAAKQRL